MEPAIRMGTMAAVIAAGLGVSASAWAGGRPDLVLAALESGRPHATGEIIVKYRDGASAVSRSAVQRGLGAARAELLRGGRAETVLLRLPSNVRVAAAVSALSTDPAVEYAEPNWNYQHAATSNDTYYANGSLWGMYGDATSPANAFGSQAAEAWAAGKTDCGDVWVGIIDEGYMWSHEDLAANAGKNPGEIAGNNVDDDGNGYVDDVYGWDFDANDSSVFDGLNDDHGTHVAGTIGAVGGNGKGVAGVCWNVKLVGAKFLGRRGGTTANAVKSVDYMTDLKTRHGINLVATNNSWGGGGFSQALQDAIERANQAGILFIAAAGNDAFNCDGGSTCYPAEYPNANVIAVASITSSGALSSFSSYGDTTVDLCAPGSGVWSTVPARVRGVRGAGSGYASYSGTSMATPHVSGAAALYKARNPSAGAAAVKAGLLGSVVPTAACNGKVASDGRLDVSGF